MKTLIFTVGLLLLFVELHAQWDFRTGYIITNSNDSIGGLVRYNGPKDQKICLFRTSLDASTQKYLPSQIKAYGFLGGNRYESADQVDKTGKVFLTALVAGRLSLFVFQHDFYVRSKGQLLLLSPSKTSASYFVTALNSLMSDCGLVANELSYIQRDLSNVIRNYNNCAGGEVKEFKVRQERSEVRYEVFASIDRSTMKSSNSNFSFNENTSVSGGAGINISFPRVNRKASLVFELWYLQKNLHAYGMYQKSIRTYYEDHFISWKAFRLPFGFRYQLTERSTTPYVEIGAVNTFVIDKDIHLVQDLLYNKEVITTETETNLASRNSFGYWGSVGITGHFIRGYRGFIEARFDKSLLGTLPGSGAQVHIINTSIVAGLRF